MTYSTRFIRLMIGALLAGVVMSACTLRRTYTPGPDYSGPVAEPQVGYRIDENRYFEIVPIKQGACANATVYYVDKAQGIRSSVVGLDGTMGSYDFTIDAANDKYLVAPITRGNTDCSSGGGWCSGSLMPYSDDGGRTWKRISAPFTYGTLVSSSAKVFYTSENRTLKILDFSEADSAFLRWNEVSYKHTEIPLPHKAPIDNKFHCTPNGKE